MNSNQLSGTSDSPLCSCRFQRWINSIDYFRLTIDYCFVSYLAEQIVPCDGDFSGICPTFCGTVRIIDNIFVCRMLYVLYRSLKKTILEGV